ncbi:alpha/beta hydrolase fold domain-containing protein [Methanobrevibacter millerae]|uniref:Acetyl esterase/lipase n=1 Tax=Methanobrevibacter millerae TaxID=230361 RepID=A0A1G5X3L7_9EURY|nr:alpha/beta hydrolase fold domain-containing protein [Methanobrevibacter millerae]SDA64862.1 Acetyl esterase/lipase [Methanobrevibacter millerae]
MSSEKSFIAKMAEIILKFTKPDYMDSKQKVDDFINDRLDSPQKPVKSIFKSIDFNGTQVFTFGDENSENAILYVHGGAYINEVNYQHLLYCRKLSGKLDSYVVVPVYPLAPLHKVEETYEVIGELYKSLMSRQNLIVMGDSAGGGFVHSFCQHLKSINLAQPQKIITFSPWVDISMGNPPYDSANDPILGEIGLREIGKSWAGEMDVKDYRVSPLFGDNEGLADCLIFAGEKEIFYRDIKKYVEKLESDGVNVKFITGQGLFHIYPLFPIPEAKKAFKELEKEIMQ